MDCPGGPQITVRAYGPTDEAAVIRVWNAALTSDPISAATWRAKVLLDPNFRPEGCPVAEVNGEVRGFLLSLTRQVPFYNDGLQPEQGWITAFAVEPGWQRQGLGTALLRAALDRLRRLGCQTVTFSTYVPNYFMPGVDVAEYGSGIDFLKARGFEVVSRPLSMRAELTGWRTPAPVAETVRRLQEDGIEIRAAAAADIVPLLDFLREHFSWDWHRDAGAVLADLFAGDPRGVSMLVALKNGKVIGYAQHRAERFGPFGVHPEMRRRGIGRALLAATLREMLKKSYHATWFLWTSDDAARLYALCGFHQTRRFAVLQRNL